MASMQKVKWRPHYFLVLIAVVMWVECIDGSRDGQLSSYFRADFQDESGMALNQMVVSNESGTDFVYIGGVSTLYQLALNLTLLRKESTVPSDPEPCGTPECLYDTKILEVAPAPVSKLVQCGGPQGKCELRNLMDISRDFGYARNIVVSVNEEVSAAVVAVRKSGDRTVFMYVALSQPQADRYEPAITQRELMHPTNPNFIFEYTGEIYGVSAPVDYIQGVSWETYNYFIAHSGSENSRLGRICTDNTQDHLEAYSEITLSCQPGSYSTLQAVYIDSNDVLYGVFTNETYSALCSYTMNDIQEKFVDATCGCVINSDTSCSGTKVSYLDDSFCQPLARADTRETIEANLQCDSSEGGSSYYRHAQATSPLIGNPLAADLPGQHSSIVTLNKENEIVALVTTSTTSTATLSKIHVQPDNTGRLYETINFDVGGNVLHDVHINQDSEELYILTTKELMQLAVVNCNQYSSCDECLGPTNDDGDPFCGWCTLETKCSRSNECSDSDTDPLNWLQYNQDCIAINNLDPLSQDIDSASRLVSFSVSQLPSIQSGSEYTCRFDEVVTDTTINGMNFTCMTPAEGDRPVIPDGENSVTMKLGIHSSLTDNIIVVEDFDFFVCSAINSCSECVMSDFGCDWCVFGGGCTLDGSSSCTAPDDIIVNAQDPMSCPRLDDVSTEILIPVGLSRAIFLTGSNIPSGPEVDYKCILSKDGMKFREVGAIRYNSTFVECEGTVYDYDPSDGLEVQVSIRVEYMAGFSLDNQENTVTLYDCSVSGVNCRSCVTTSIRAELGCGWCTGSLSCLVDAIDEPCDGDFFGRGQSDSCPAPQITTLFPVAGPVEGNTTLTISGTNLPAEENETVNITVAGVECLIIDGSLNPGISIDCSTGSSDNQTLEGVVTVVFVFGTASSDESFIYRNPKVTGFSPLTGIKAGGTEMDITGEDLDTGRVIRVSVGEAECNIMENGVTPEMIQCLTGSSDVGNAAVTVSFDGAERVVPGEYSYVKDPVITGYTPKESIMSTVSSAAGKSSTWTVWHWHACLLVCMQTCSLNL